VPGSIVLMHDSLKTKQNLEYVLPATLAHFRQKGYDFAALNDQPAQISR
jgi:peptidoglycan-N-acetylglucosamine deacetylase